MHSRLVVGGKYRPQSASEGGTSRNGLGSSVSVYHYRLKRPQITDIVLGCLRNEPSLYRLDIQMRRPRTCVRKTGRMLKALRPIHFHFVAQDITTT